MEDLREVRQPVYPAREKWHDIGLELGVPVDALENIRSHQFLTDNGGRLQEVLKIWLRTPSLNPTWESLAKALKSDYVGREDLAQKIGMYIDINTFTCPFSVPPCIFPYAKGYCHTYYGNESPMLTPYCNVYSENESPTFSGQHGQLQRVIATSIERL